MCKRNFNFFSLDRFDRLVFQYILVNVFLLALGRAKSEKKSHIELPVNLFFPEVKNIRFFENFKTDAGTLQSN